MDRPELLTVPEASSYLRLRPSTGRAWLLQRRIQHVKMGGRVLLRRCDLEKLVERSVIPAESLDGGEGKGRGMRSRHSCAENDDDAPRG
jgi:excisionase family DNA binding protein